MKHKYYIFTICLFCVVLMSLPSLAAEISATFTFGKIEILKSGEQEWVFLEKKIKLTEFDLVRMPPVSLIRLKDTDGALLPTLTGGREIYVGQLIREGQQKNATKGKRINKNFEDASAIDVLPVHTQPKKSDHQHSPDTVQSIKITQSELDKLRSQLDAIPDEIARLIPQLPSWKSHESTSFANQYPFLNLYKAQILYDELGNIESETPDDMTHSLLYAQLLRHVGIDVDLAINKTGELVVVFDSQVSLEQETRVSANQKLVHRRTQSDTIWISIQIQPRKPNFTTAWYEGSK